MIINFATGVLLYTYGFVAQLHRGRLVAPHLTDVLHSASHRRGATVMQCGSCTDESIITCGIGESERDLIIE